MSCFQFIVEDGTCVEGANTFALIDCARDYWVNRFGGEKWDKSFTGENYCDADIQKALIGAIDYLNGMHWPVQCCGNNSCVPTPQSCSCTGKTAIQLLKEAQIVLADAILRGWNPHEVKPIDNSPLVTSMSSPDEGSVTFARPTSLNCYMGKGTSDELGRVTKQRVRNILRPLLPKKSKGRRVIS